MDIHPAQLEDERQVNLTNRLPRSPARARRFPRLVASVLLAAALAGCGGPTDPGDVDLTGRWRGTVSGLGIEFVTLDLTETEAQINGTGQWTATDGTGGTVSAIGIHFGAELQLRLAFARGTTEDAFVVPGRLEGADEFYLLFPSDPPKRVTFVR